MINHGCFAIFKLAVNQITILLVILLLTIAGQSYSSTESPGNEQGQSQNQTEVVDEGSDMNNEELFDLPLEQLLDIEVSSNMLTTTTFRKIPSTMTIISKEEIQSSGARSLYELLEIYVPNFQIIFSPYKTRHMGLRGIIDGRDDKYLILVNGYQVNEHTDYGALTERDLPMLSDLQKVEVIRGPGSILYGPGALAMVINLIVETPETAQGTEIVARTGIVERFNSLEFNWAKMLSKSKGLLIYGGTSHYPGADPEDSEIRFGSERATKYGVPYSSGQYYSGRMKNYNAAYGGLPKEKVHVHYTHNENLSIWARHTQGGEYIDGTEWNPQENGLQQRDILYGIGYQQQTIVSEYKMPLSDSFSIRYRFGYDTTEVESEPYQLARELKYREDKYRARAIANWEINDYHQLAFGTEYVKEYFGLKPRSENETLNYRMGDKTDMPEWSTDMVSFVAEHQWTITDNLVSFVGARVDDHTYSKPMYSPRATLVYTPTEIDTLKVTGSRATRTNVAEDMKLSDIGGETNSDHEVLDTYEVRYERQQNKNLLFGVGSFFNSQDLVSWNWTTSHNDVIATFESWGLEAEVTWKSDRFMAGLSHSYSKLLDVEMKNGATATELTGMPNGYGDDYANWSNHQTKLNFQYNFIDRWTLSNSLITYWGYPGGEDYAKLCDVSNGVIYDPRANEAFKASWFWNMGVQYDHNENLSLRFDAYNILGWIDKDMGKRRNGIQTNIPAMYRVQPAAFGLELRLKF